MSIGKRIKQRRELLGITQYELAKKIGVAASAIGNYENNISHPRENILYKLFDALNCDANFLFQDEMPEYDKSNSFTDEELTLIKKYRSLDETSKAAVNNYIDFECIQSQKRKGDV